MIPEEKEQQNLDSPSKIAVFGNEKGSESRLISRSNVKINQNSIINQEFIGTMMNSYINE